MFDVEVFREEYTYVVDYDIGALYGNAVYVERSVGRRLKTSELTVEDVQKSLDQFGIKMLDSLVEELSEWRREFFESEAYAEAMRMAATESGDW